MSCHVSPRRRGLSEDCNNCFVAESRKGNVTPTLTSSLGIGSSVHCTPTGPCSLDTFPHLKPLRCPRGCLTSNHTAKSHAVLISAKTFRRRGRNEDRNRSPGSFSSLQYSSPSQSLDLPPTSMSIGSASQCSLANRGQWEIAFSGVSPALGRTGHG